jgi:hypothetical protein
MCDVCYLEVEPLVVPAGVGVCSHVQVVLVTFDFDDSVEISALESTVKNKLRGRKPRTHCLKLPPIVSTVPLCHVLIRTQQTGVQGKAVAIRSNELLVELKGVNRPKTVKNCRVFFIRQNIPTNR